MDSVAGFLVEALAKAVDDARKKGEAAALQAPGLPQSAPRQPAVGARPAVRAPSPRVASEPQRVAAYKAAPAHRPPSQLLAAFRAHGSLLGAFVLAEALAPPVALRVDPQALRPAGFPPAAR